METKNLTKITTSLPYCLYRIDSRFFKIPDRNGTKIRFIKKETTPNRRLEKSVNMETIRDRWGIDAHSDVEILTKNTFDEVKDAEAYCLKLINNFIKIYRYFDKEAVHLVPLIPEDLFGFNYLNRGRGAMIMSFAGGITSVNPLLIHDISNQVEELVDKDEEIPFWEELIMNAEQYHYQGDFRHSLLESVIALELMISNFIRKKCAEKGISTSDADEYIKKVGLSGNIKVNIKLLLTDEKSLPDDEVFKDAKAGITIRNAIVHKGRQNVGRRESEETKKATKELIKFFVAFL